MNSARVNPAWDTKLCKVPLPTSRWLGIDSLELTPGKALTAYCPDTTGKRSIYAATGTDTSTGISSIRIGSPSANRKAIASLICRATSSGVSASGKLSPPG